MNADKEPVENSVSLIVAGLIACLIALITSVEPISSGVSELMDGIATEALEVKFDPGIAFLAFAMITVVGVAIIAVIQLFKIKAPDHILAFIVNCIIFGGVAGFSARIVSPYAVGYYLENRGYSFCEYRTVRGYRKITKLSWVRYESMCEDEIDLTGLTEAKLQEHLRTEEGALAKAKALGMFLK